MSKMDSMTLQPVTASTSLGSGGGYVEKTETNLTIQCHDRGFKHVTITDDEGEELFTLETSKFLTSWSVRRSLADRAGNHILDVRHHRSRLSRWIIEDPRGTKLGTVKDGVHPVQKSTDATAEVVTTSESAVAITIQSLDRSGTRTAFRLGPATIAEMTLTDNNDLTFLKTRGLARTAWTLRVAPGVDLATVLALAFCRAEISHLWRR